MGVPIYQRATTGVAVADTATSWDVAHNATVNAYEVAIMHITRRSTTGTVNTPSGWSLIMGPNSSGTHRSYVFGRICNGTEGGTNVTLTISNDSTVRTARIYYFSGAQNIAALYWEGTATTTGTAATISAASVVSAARNRLAISLTSIANDNAVADFAGETGGNWTETLAQFTTTVGSDACLQLQTAGLTSATTLSGGTMINNTGTGLSGTANAWVVQAFALKGRSMRVTWAELELPMAGAAASAVGTATGTGTAAGTLGYDHFVVGNAAGTGTAVATTQFASYQNAVGNAEGTSDAQGVFSTAQIVDTVGNAEGTSTATAVTQFTSYQTAIGTAAGIAAAVGTLASTQYSSAIGNAEGTSTAAAVTEFTSYQATVGNAAGTSDAQGVLVGGQFADSIGTAAGTSTATAVTEFASYQYAAGNAAGTSNVQGVLAAGAITEAVGNAAGTSDAQGALYAEVYATGNAEGRADCQGVLEDGAVPASRDAVPRRAGGGKRHKYVPMDEWMREFVRREEKPVPIPPTKRYRVPKLRHQMEKSGFTPLELQQPEWVSFWKAEKLPPLEMVAKAQIDAEDEEWLTLM